MTSESSLVSAGGMVTGGRGVGVVVVTCGVVGGSSGGQGEEALPSVEQTKPERLHKY